MYFKSSPHSYKELPYRIAEIAQQFRYEKSGELSGLNRVRMFCLADAHIICQKEEAKNEIKRVLNLIDFVNEIFGFKKGKDYRYRLSLGNREDSKKYFKDDKAWDFAEDVLRSVLKELKAPYFEAENEAAFYGPKIDIQMKRVTGQEETAITVQYDFVMPERFDLSYTDENGKKMRPIVIHRSSIGAIERIFAFLIEKYAGAFPLWLSPVQVVLLPVGKDHIKHSQQIADQLQDHEVRVEVYSENETIGSKIRKASKEKIPYVIVIGDKELSQSNLAVRVRGQEKLSEILLADFIKEVVQKIKEKNKSLTLK